MQKRDPDFEIFWVQLILSIALLFLSSALKSEFVLTLAVAFFFLSIKSLLLGNGNDQESCDRHEHEMSSLDKELLRNPGTLKQHYPELFNQDN